MKNTEDKMIQDLRDGRVATMADDSDAILSAQKEKTKEGPKPNQNLLARIDELTRQRVESFEQKQRLLEEKYQQQQIASQVDVEVSEQIQKETEQTQLDVQEEQVQECVATPSFSGKTEIEVQVDEEKESEIENEAKNKQRAKKVKFRVKFISIAVCIAIALFSGLAIHNAVKITKLSSEVSAAQSQVEVNTAKYIYKISKIDDLIEDGKKAPVDSFQIGADRYLESYPEELEDVTEIAESSNWFDRFVNKIRKFFGAA